MKSFATAMLLFLIVSCGMAQEQGIETFSIKTDSLLDDNNRLTPSANVMVEKIAAKMNSFSSSCLNINHSCIHESDTICYQKLKTFMNALIVKVPAGQFFGPASGPVHMSCEDCFEFIISECQEVNPDKNLSIIIIKEDENTDYSPPVIVKESEDTVGIKILEVLSKNRRIARICKDTTWILNNPYNIVYFIDTTKILGITGNLFESDFCIITHDKDLSKNNRYKTLFVTYFKHGNFSGDVSLITGDRKKVTTVDCELIAESSGNWKVHHIKIKKRKNYKIKR